MPRAALGLVLCAMTVAGCGGAGSSARLVSASNPTGHCLGAIPGRDWAYLGHHSTEFGLDMVTIAGNRAVVVTSVDLMNSHGLRIADVAFVAGGAVGDGFVFGDSRAATFPDAWRSRVELKPTAALFPLTADSLPVIGDWSKSPVWQVVVGLVAVGTRGGGTTGLRIRYQADGHSREFIGNTRVAIVGDLSTCEAAEGGPL